MKIAVDLGGTNLRVAQVEKGVVMRKLEERHGGQTSQALLSKLISAIKQLYNERIDGIGIGVPSILDATSGEIYLARNIAAWQQINLKTELAAQFNVPIQLNNDANCFIWGEKCYGLGQNFKHLVGLTLGTGLGAGIIANGKLYGGYYTGAGEINAIPYLDRDYESYCSGKFFNQRFQSDGQTMLARAASGDNAARAAWQTLGTHLGKLIQAVILMYSPEAVIFGGGLARAHAYFETSLRQSLQENCRYPLLAERLKIYFSQNPDMALLGAAEL